MTKYIVTRTFTAEVNAESKASAEEAAESLFAGGDLVPVYHVKRFKSKKGTKAKVDPRQLSMPNITDPDVP